MTVVGFLIITPIAYSEMAYQKQISFLILQLLFLTLVLASANGNSLKLGFYLKTCPKAEAIVETVTADHISLAPSLAAPLLRMHFHDSEKSGPPNLSLRGFQVIDAAKTALEKACPGVVSCADILALVARDAIYQIKVVPLGRRDGRVSIALESLTLPAPFGNITELKAQFASKGLSVKDLVVLSGGHTVGTSHCSTIAIRLYNFTGKGDTDPSLDPKYVPYLKSKCKPTDTTTLLEMDPGSFRTFDEAYYTNVLKRRGLFQSDAALLADKETSAYVKLQAQSGGSTFFKDFEESMVKMGQIGVLTGSAGEIRKHCALVN
ncbi:hypothetical protein L2E82_10819 [Cichorium intybus]|uniref:Uncharacterized protein n=1 Tax=Cichorium intybus TaxID=13427 RepID=A0ACB9GBQ4_CICIN|nr:hypothetical protein L2E82_10819 [Cichorium intybus]